MTDDAALIDWMLDTDPALRWRVERDLVGAPPEVWQATGRAWPPRVSAHDCSRFRMPTASGRAARSFPKDFDFEGPEAAHGAGQP